MAPRQYLAYAPDRITMIAATGTPADRATHIPKFAPNWRATVSSIPGGVARTVRQRVSHSGSCCAADQRWMDFMQVPELGEQLSGSINLDIQAGSFRFADRSAGRPTEAALPDLAEATAQVEHVGAVFLNLELADFAEPGAVCSWPQLNVGHQCSLPCQVGEAAAASAAPIRPSWQMGPPTPQGRGHDAATVAQEGRREAVPSAQPLARRMQTHTAAHVLVSPVGEDSVTPGQRLCYYRAGVRANERRPYRRGTGPSQLAEPHLISHFPSRVANHQPDFG